MHQSGHPLIKTDRAVSTVIGVILMVAITVILAAVVGTYVLDMGQNTGEAAPSAVLTVDADSENDFLNLSHRGGDGIDAQRTRVVITNESTDTSITFSPTGSSDVFTVGESVDLDVATGNVDSPKWGSMNSANSLPGIAPGNRYGIQIIDTESQRVIYETTVAA